MQRQAEQPGLEVPQGDVDRGDGVAGDARAAGVADRGDHAVQARPTSTASRTGDDVGELVADHRGAGRWTVGPPDPACSPARPGPAPWWWIPGQGAVGLGLSVGIVYAAPPPLDHPVPGSRPRHGHLLRLGAGVDARAPLLLRTLDRCAYANNDARGVPCNRRQRRPRSRPPIPGTQAVHLAEAPVAEVGVRGYGLKSVDQPDVSAGLHSLRTGNRMSGGVARSVARP